MTAKNKEHARILKGEVSKKGEHFIIYFGSADDGVENQFPIALVGKGPKPSSFVYEFLPVPKKYQENEETIKKDTLKDINYFLLELEPDPDAWTYMKYWTTTTSNFYGELHWYIGEDSESLKISPLN